MKRYVFFLYFFLNLYILYNHAVFSCEIQLQYQSHNSDNNYKKVVLQNKINDNVIKINSDDVKIEYPYHSIFTGNVKINHGNIYLQADKIKLYQKQIENDKKERASIIIDAFGNVQFDDQKILLKGSKGRINLTTRYISIWNGKYKLAGYPGHGEACLIKQFGKSRNTILKNSSFNLCPLSCNTWSIFGNKVIINHKKKIARIWNARFKIGSLPVFYIPYLSLPLSNEHYSGFLSPHIKYSKLQSFELSFPYYWNITKKTDITIIPHYIHKFRNVIWENEFRYLTQAGYGIVKHKYLFLKKKHSQKKEKNQHYYILHWNHCGVMKKNWRFLVDYTKINYNKETNNFTYFKDFKSINNNNNNNDFKQIFSVGYASKYMSINLSTKAFHTFNVQLNDHYSITPHLEIKVYPKYLGPFNIYLHGQMTRFINMNYNIPISYRVHFEPTVSIPFRKDSATVNFETKLMVTHYQQKILNHNNKLHKIYLINRVNRILPQFKVDGKFILERYFHYRHRKYKQALEPCIQYLYIPYFNINKIQYFDSLFFQYDHNNFFCERTLCNFHHFLTNRQFKIGIITRILDKNFSERFNCFVGKICYFLDPNIVHDNFKENKNIEVLSADTFCKVSKNFGVRGNLKYNMQLGNLITGNSEIKYSIGRNRLIQLNYRYINHKCIKSIYLYNNINKEEYQKSIYQFGIVSNWSIDNYWSIVGSCYFDAKKKRITNRMAGVQYNACCYSVRFSYENKFNGWNMKANRSEYNNIIKFSIELYGIRSKKNSENHTRLYSTMLPYRQLF